MEKGAFEREDIGQVSNIEKKGRDYDFRSN